jgi:MinD superfamily P-loop ATPase
MKVAVASGKGGTGKTTVAASLAWVWPRPAVAVDLDVEAPNLHLFLKPQIEGRETAFLTVPQLDPSKCDLCRACAELCQFKAISVLGQMVLTFPEMCHGCGGCLAVCPRGALTPGQRELGEILWGYAGRLAFMMGRSRVGEAMSPPLMRAVKGGLARQFGDAAMDVIIDAPPGVSCPAVNAVMDADVIVLVTEPTPFGLYDLRLAGEAFRPLGKSMGLVINRAGIDRDGSGTRALQAYSREENLPIWAEIPYTRDIAQAYAAGQIVAAAAHGMDALFRRLAQRIRKGAAAKGETCHA